MKELLIKKYEAVDGTQFDDIESCLKYELIEAAKLIQRHCLNMTNCLNCILRKEDSNECILKDVPPDWDLTDF